MYAFLNNLLDLIFPPSTERRLAQTISLEELALRARPRAVPSLADSIALFDFTDPLIRSLIHEMKYRRNKRIADVFGALLADSVESDEDIRDVLLVPVPLATKKRRARGYNQAEWIARGVVAHAPEGRYSLECRALERVRETESQTAQKSRAARLENVRHAFGVPDPTLVHGKDILLVDDVATTGATASDARRALKAAGARSVRIALVATGAR